MAIAQVQTKTGTNTSTTSITVTFDSSPTQNNLLVACLQSNDGSCTDPSGWTRAVDFRNATEDDLIVIAYKVAGAGESSSVQFTNFAGNTKLLGISEWSGLATASVVDQTNTQARATGATSLTSSSITTTTADELIVCTWAVRDATVSALASLTNSFSTLHDLNNTTSFAGYSGYRIVSATGSYASTASWTNAATTWAGIASFKIAAAGGSVVGSYYYRTVAGLGG